MNRTRQLLLFFVLTMAQGAWGQTVSKYHVGQMAANQDAATTRRTDGALRGSVVSV